MANDFLTLMQHTFLQRFFNTDVGQRFFLTGGTALSAFHLHHRLSDDLDLFTLDDDALIGVDHQIEEIAFQLDWGIVRARRAEYFRQFHFALRSPRSGEVGTSLQVDMVHDFGPQYGQRQVVGGILVDAIENIGANKITAILGRTDSKDFVDLYFILQAGYDFEELFAMAQQKDLGLLEFYFASALLQVNRLTRLPKMKRSLDLPTLQAFFTSIANEMLDRLNPDVTTPPLKR